MGGYKVAAAMQPVVSRISTFSSLGNLTNAVVTAMKIPVNNRDKAERAAILTRG
jgi:hypothetical protein